MSCNDGWCLILLLRTALLQSVSQGRGQGRDLGRDLGPDLERRQGVVFCQAPRPSWRAGVSLPLVAALPTLLVKRDSNDKD